MIDYLYVGPGDFIDVRVFGGLDAYDAHFGDNRFFRCPGSGCEFCAKGLGTFARTVLGVVDDRDGKCKAWVVSPKMLNELRSKPDLTGRGVRIIRGLRLEPPLAIPLEKKRFTKKQERLNQDFRKEYNTHLGRSINSP